ncbi:MAG: DUF2961 domain-containing protein [Ruminococcaceae bacterium]|jgi:hypothetical protein|nr:DUF2961 domain-containing protein [Oscillospiraceae bacterium]
MTFFSHLTQITKARTKRVSSWDSTGRNGDAWRIEPGERSVLADLTGPGQITHIWMTQGSQDPEILRKIVLIISWDNEEHPSVQVPLGDFYGLGHAMVNSYQSLFFTASTRHNHTFSGSVALNSYLPMPFNRSARIELLNESELAYHQYFYIDYELFADEHPAETAYFHACFKRENPTTGWGHEITVNAPPANIANLSDQDNYLLLDAVGEGHFIGFNLSVTNLQTSLKNPHQRTWWGEGDEMIFIDGEPWPPSLHGTGSEDALNQAYGMQPNAYLFNGSSIYEEYTGGYQTSYVFYAANPVRFTRSIKASIEHGHGNHLSNEYASVAYWYQKEPHQAFDILPVMQRLPLIRSFSCPEGRQTDPTPLTLTDEMQAMKRQWQETYADGKKDGFY